MERSATDASADLPAPAETTFSVGRWRVDPAADTLALEGRTVKLEPRTMRLLVALAEHPGAVVASQVLLERVWAGVVVTSQSLYQAIGELRAVLEADARTAKFISTIPRKGYQLVAPVARCPEELPARFDRAVAEPTPPRIAVLPFRDLGIAPHHAFVCEALLGDLVLELSRQPGLATIARGTMLSYLGLTVAPRRIADELGARYVVDGSIAPAGDGLAISCELIDAASETVLASEAVEVPAAQWHVIGLRVVGRLARALRLELTEHAARTVDVRAPQQASALELSTRAWVELYCRPQTRETNDRAWALADQALQRDTSIGAAWNALAYSEWRAAQYAWHERPWEQLLADAMAHAERATALAPANPDAHYTLGIVSYTSGQTERAEATLRHCLRISASYAPAWALLGTVRAVLGHPEETSGLCARAFELSPREPLRAVWHWGEGFAASMLGREREALEFATRGIAANPAFPSCYLVAAVAAWRLGRAAEAARYVTVLRDSAFCSIERLRRQMPPMRVDPWAAAFLADLHRAGLPER